MIALGFFALGSVALSILKLSSVTQPAGRLASTTPDSIKMRNHTARQLHGITGDILRGEILRSEGSQRLHSRKLRSFDEVAFQ